ncbi:MAG: AHH domain-containing protein [Cystobacter sp.]
MEQTVRLSLPARVGAVQVSDVELNEALATLVLDMPLRVAGSHFPLHLHRKLAHASLPLSGEAWRTPLARSYGSFCARQGTPGDCRVRILLLLGTAAAGETAALVSRAPALPGFAKAAGALESHAGIRDVLTAVREADRVKVAVAEGTFTVVLPAHVVSMAARGPPARADPPKKTPEVHHIATVENEVSTARGGPWTPRFKKLFDKAGMRMKDAENTVPRKVNPYASKSD